MARDPITRIIGNLGIYTKIDFANRVVTECHSTSSLFRGLPVSMKGKDLRDAGLHHQPDLVDPGDNHTVCSVYAQNMAYGIKSLKMAEMITNLGEAAEYLFDHMILQDNLVFVDFARPWSSRPTRACWPAMPNTRSPRAEVHGLRTIADIMRAFNPFEGEVYKEVPAGEPGDARETFCLDGGGRHVHPSTIYPGGVGTMPSPSLFTDYLSRLLDILDFVKKAVALNDDIFDFW